MPTERRGPYKKVDRSWRSEDPPEDQDGRVLNILEMMKDYDMDVATFMERYFSSQNEKVRQKVGVFMSLNGFGRLFDAILPHMNFAPNRRYTQAAIVDLKATLGKGIWKSVQQILEFGTKLSRHNNDITNSH